MFSSKVGVDRSHETLFVRVEVSSMGMHHVTHPPGLLHLLFMRPLPSLRERGPRC